MEWRRWEMLNKKQIREYKKKRRTWGEMRAVVVNREEWGRGEGMRWRIETRWDVMWWDEVKWDEMGWHKLWRQWDANRTIKKSCDETTWFFFFVDGTGRKVKRLLLPSEEGRPAVYRQMFAALEAIGYAFQFWNFRPLLALLLRVSIKTSE